LNIQQLRYSSKRFKAPPVGKEKQKWGTGSKYAEVEPLIRPVSEEIQGRVPLDDVWIMKHYPQQFHSFEDAISIHREFCMPEMFNRPDALVIFHATLDMRTKKKTRFMSHMKRTVNVPHSFEDGTLNRIVAFCKAEEEIAMAEKLGATFVGGADLIKMFEKREILPEDYEHVVCTVDMMSDITVLRKHLRDSFPSKARGTLGTDISVLVETFMRGKTFESFKSSESVGHLVQPIGRLNMPMDHLVNNFNTFVQSISSLRNASLGPTITEGAVSCPPSEEKLLLSKEWLTPAKNEAQTVDEGSDDEGAEAMA